MNAKHAHCGEVSVDHPRQSAARTAHCRVGDLCKIDQDGALGIDQDGALGTLRMSVQFRERPRISEGLGSTMLHRSVLLAESDNVHYVIR